MEQPDLVSKYRASLIEGADVKVCSDAANLGGSETSNEWKHAKVVSSSEDALTVAYGDGGQEVIPWKSGRICTSNK